MKSGLVPGVMGELSIRVTSDVAIALGDAPGTSVFSTPSMVDLMEHAARAAVTPFLEDDDETVGAEISIRHVAPTPVGQTVRAIARLMTVEGRSLTFELEAYDETQKIGEGTHKRVVISLNRFRDKLDASGQPSPAPRADLDPASYTTISFRSEGGIGYLTLNRPDVLNAVTVQMTAEIEDLLARLADDDTTRVLIVTGADRAFCAGDDIKEFQTLNEHEAELLSLRQARMYLRFADVPQPIIAAVNGPAFGAGCVCAASCDVRIASYTATFGMPETKLGWAPGYGNAQLMSLIGRGRALEMVLTCEPLSAQEAYRIGLVEHIVPQNNLLSAAEDMARTMLAMPPVALRETKRLLRQDEALNPREAYVNDTAAYIRCLKTDDAKEGIAAFIGKRKPVWKGR